MQDANTGMEVVEGCKVDVDHVLRWLRDVSACRVLVQSPLGLRKTALWLGGRIISEGYEVYLSSSNCWGGCDVAYNEASGLNVDAIVHLGHSRFLRKDKIPTIYVECRYSDDSPLRSLARQLSGVLQAFRVVGLGASVQWLDQLNTVIDSLQKDGIKVLTAQPEMYSVYEAQVLGCDATGMKKIENNVDAYLVVGSVFHGLGVALLTSKTTFAADPHTQKIVDLTSMRNKILGQRYANIEAFRIANRVGVLVSVKPGQKRHGLALRINKLLRSHGKQSYLLTSDEITPSTVLENKFEAFVNTACPRLSIEDQSQFSKPLLLPAESLVALGLLEWSEVVDRGLLMYPWGWSDKESSRRFWNRLREVES
ncbi:MAG: diphthamide biosynthesis enzyme Dph2 [Candidatus Caldarchaeum sp.]